MPWVKPPTEATAAVYRPYSSSAPRSYHAANRFMRCVWWMRGVETTLEDAESRNLHPCRRCFGNQSTRPAPESAAPSR